MPEYGRILCSAKFWFFNMLTIKKTIKKFIPKFVIIFMRKLIYIAEYLVIYRQERKHIKAIAEIKNNYRRGAKIKIAFFVLNTSVWKLDKLYNVMLTSEIFEPIIIVCPVVNNGKEYMISELSKTYNYFYDKGYKPINSYDVDTNKYLDINKTIQPDIIFYTNPYKGLIHSKYFITKFTQTLTCYVPYSFFATSNYSETGDTLFYNLVWKAFCETEYHLNEIKSNQRVKGKNLVVSGYPSCEILKNEEIEMLRNPWKNRNLKKIIWAPHWLPLEIFLRDADYMLELAKKNINKLEIAFKPHPLIKKTLYNNENWGREKTDSYYKEWSSCSNTLLIEDDYQGLFWNSDALIHNSGSFISEYMVTKNPCLFVTREIDYMVNNSKCSDLTIKWNDYGKKALEKHYHAYSQEDIVTFIKDIVVDGNDIMIEDRISFVENIIVNNKDKSATENIYDTIVYSIENLDVKK